MDAGATKSASVLWSRILISRTRLPGGERFAGHLPAEQAGQADQRGVRTWILPAGR